MHKVLLFLSLLASLELSGCGALLERWEADNYFMVSAKDIDLSLSGTAYAGKFPDVTKVSADQSKEFLGAVVSYSESKCGDFLNGLTLAENTSNTGLDIGSTIFSALGTAFTATSTIHAMTAGASIFTGSKTAIDSDIYGKATIANYAQAIQESYYAQINNYISALQTSDSSKIVISLEIDKIKTIHKQCSLGAAQSTVSATLTAAASQSGSTTTDKWVASTVRAGDEFHLIASQAVSQLIDLDIKATDATPADLATQVASAINGANTLQKSGVSATVEGDSITIDINTPSTITWSVSPPTETDLQHVTPTPNAVSAALGAVQTTTAKTGSVSTKGSVVGGAIQNQ